MGFKSVTLLVKEHCAPAFQTVHSVSYYNKELDKHNSKFIIVNNDLIWILNCEIHKIACRS